MNATARTLPLVPDKAPPAAEQRSVYRRMLRNPGMLAGIVILLLIALMGVAAPLLTSLDPAAINPAYRNKVPGAEATVRADDGTKRTVTHWMGTDSLGRDIYSRVVSPCWRPR